MRCLVIGCGLIGAVIARELAERGTQVEIWERRDHIGGNMYDYVDEHGFLVQKYGPHTFHTTKKKLYDYVCRFEEWQAYHLTCGAVWEDKYTPTPFNFATIDTFYPPEEAERLKEKLKTAFEGRKTATMVEALAHSDSDIRAYAEYLFQNDYAPYTAKQWGISPKEIDPSILNRVPLRFSCREGERLEPYYPVLTADSQLRFAQYQKLAEQIPNLICCDRLADFKYYNMDQALERALTAAENL